MPNNSLINSLAVPFERSYDFFMQFIAVCPDDVWASQFGGWPVWQQVTHTLTAFDFFIVQEGQTMPGTFPREMTSLQVQGTEIVSKQAIKDFAAEAKTRVEAYLAGLTLATLDTVNQGFVARTGKELTHGATIAMLAAHNFYHLGACDAALRERGLPGVF